MSDKIKLEEGSKEFKDIKTCWEKAAEAVIIETLPQFLNKLINDYEHDYGTICHAMAIAAKASATAINKSPCGGITGFQAGAVMWEFIKSWNYSDNKTGLRLIDYDKFLYPQYQCSFEKRIYKDVWENIQKQAMEHIFKADEDYEKYLFNKAQWDEDINTFVEKYPDYPENQEKYDRLSFGTGEEWEREREKKESGFEFAPSKPCHLVNREGDVYQHWVQIAEGVVPFGYTVVEEY